MAFSIRLVLPGNATIQAVGFLLVAKHAPKTKESHAKSVVADSFRLLLLDCQCR